MIRTCIVALSSGVVVNIVDYENPVTGSPPGMTDEFLPVPSEIAQIGWLWNGKILSPAKSAETVADARLRMWVGIKSERDRRTENGGYRVGVNWFHSDQKSRSQQLGLVLLGANIPTSLQWKTMDGSFITMTPALSQQILSAAAASDQALFNASEKHKEAMESLTDPAAYEFTDGWPKVFGE